LRESTWLEKLLLTLAVGVLTHGRVRLLFLSKGHSYPMDAKLSVLNLDILKKQMAWKHVSRMTENTVPLPLGPKDPLPCQQALHQDKKPRTKVLKTQSLLTAWVLHSNINRVLKKQPLRKPRSYRIYYVFGQDNEESQSKAPAADSKTHSLSSLRVSTAKPYPYQKEVLT
ncbi:hypothetical protein U0070_004966, partial [Myodes glareolus]